MVVNYLYGPTTTLLFGARNSVYGNPVALCHVFKCMWVRGSVINFSSVDFAG